MTGRSGGEGKMIRAETVFTLEVAGQAVLMFQALTTQEAKALPREQWIRDDLRDAYSNGAPIWDGKEKLSVRRANPDEAARFSKAITGAEDDSGDLVLVYLVELDA